MPSNLSEELQNFIPNETQARTRKIGPNKEEKKKKQENPTNPRILPSKSIPKSWLNKAIDRNGNEKEIKPFQPNQKGKRNQPKLFSPK